MSETNLYLSVVIPCLDEEKTIGTCIHKASAVLQEMQVASEIIVADNGSKDASRQIARQLGAKVVTEQKRGYGHTLRTGFQAAEGRYIIIFDADDSYDVTSIPLLVESLEKGCDLVVGNRFQGGIRPGAMPLLHRYFGNPLLSAVYRILFRGTVGDINCGLRGIRRSSLPAMDLQTNGMEFCAEMIILATVKKMKIAEVPTVLYPDGRGGPPHLKSWRDGWRVLIFMLRTAIQGK